MAYSLNLASRVEKVLESLHPIAFESKKMFGGVCYLFYGNIACGVHQENLIVRVGKVVYEEMLTRPGVAPFDLTGRAMGGWIFVEPSQTRDDDSLRSWVEKGVEFASTLPKK